MVMVSWITPVVDVIVTVALVNLWSGDNPEDGKVKIYVPLNTIADAAPITLKNGAYTGVPSS